MTMDDEKNGFAAEYVLGTLDAEERAQADALMLADPDFAAAVRQWERRLGELNVLVAPVEPPAPVWDKIKAALADVPAGEPLRLPDMPAPVAPEPQGPSAEVDRPDAAHAALARPDGDDRRAGGLLRRHRDGARISSRRASARLAPETAGGRARRREAGRSRAGSGARGAGGAAGAIRRGVPEGRAVARVRAHRRRRKAHADGARGRGATDAGSRFSDLDSAAAGRAARSRSAW